MPPIDPKRLYATLGIEEERLKPGDIRMIDASRIAKLKPKEFPKAGVTPTLNVSSERHQLGGWVTVSGDRWPANSNVEVFADNITGRTAPYSLGIVGVQADGHFVLVADVRCVDAHDKWRPVTIRAVDGIITLVGSVDLAVFYCLSP